MDLEEIPSPQKSKVIPESQKNSQSQKENLKLKQQLTWTFQQVPQQNHKKEQNHNSFQLKQIPQNKSKHNFSTIIVHLFVNTPLLQYLKKEMNLTANLFKSIRETELTLLCIHQFLQPTQGSKYLKLRQPTGHSKFL